MSASPAEPLVSVVVPTHNAARFLAECLTSVFAQTGHQSIEVIVVDDASTDGTCEIASAFDGVRLVRHTVNQGAGAARNAGISQARGEWVAFLDADDIWPARSLEARVEVLQRQASVALVFGDCRQFDEQGPRMRTLFEEGGFGGPAWGQGELVPDAYERLLVDNFITTGSVVARRSALLAAGGFASDLRLVEDLDLWLRMARRHAIGWLDEVCLLRRRHDTNLSRDPQAMSLAYLEVLRRQRNDRGTTEPGLSLRLIELGAREHLLMADRALASREASAALRWAWSSLTDRPTARAAWMVARAIAAKLQASPPRHPPTLPR